MDKGGNDDDELSCDESGCWKGKGGGDMDDGLDGEAKIVSQNINLRGYRCILCHVFNCCIIKLI